MSAASPIQQMYPHISWYHP